MADATRSAGLVGRRAALGARVDEGSWVIGLQGVATPRLVGALTTSATAVLRLATGVDTAREGIAAPVAGEDITFDFHVAEPTDEV